jgi:hypothetical protein
VCFALSHVVPHGSDLITWELHVDQIFSCLDGRRLVWFSNEDVHKGYAVTFIALTMHAISRDVEAYPEPCIYTQVNISKFRLSVLINRLQKSLLKCFLVHSQ